MCRICKFIFAKVAIAPEQGKRPAPPGQKKSGWVSPDICPVPGTSRRSVGQNQEPDGGVTAGSGAAAAAGGAEGAGAGAGSGFAAGAGLASGARVASGAGEAGA